MGSTAVLVWAAPAAPFSHPRAVIGGHIVSACVGVTFFMLLGDALWLAIPAATAGAIMAMQLTRTLHPPAGGTVLISLAVADVLGYSELYPVALTSALLAVGGLLNNFSKHAGRQYPGASGPPATAMTDIATSGGYSFLGMGLLSAAHFGLSGCSDMTMIIGSMGASAVLVWAAPSLPFSQPRNVIGGHVVSAFVGITSSLLLGSQMWLAVPSATSCAIMAMQATNTVHPPAGGTALVALGMPTLVDSSRVADMGYSFMCPVALTSTLIVAGGVALNNLSRTIARHYPTRWL